MKAYVVEKLSPNPSDHQIKDVPTPKCPENGVLIQVHATGLNFFDLLMLEGKYQYRPNPPFVPGSEFAGKILEIGSKLSHSRQWPNLKVGDMVFGSSGAIHGNGSLCEVLALENPGQFDLLPIPKGLDAREAASIRIIYTTAYHALVQRGQIKKGEWVLIHAAAGGVGTAAVQICKWLGCNVIATCGSDAKCKVVKELGADHVINYNTDKTWWETVKGIMKSVGKTDEWGNKDPGVDVVYDVVGLVSESMKCTCYNARILLIGFTGRSPTNPELVKTNLVLVKGQNIMHVTMGATVFRNPKFLPEIWDGIFKLFETTPYRPVVYPERYRLQDTATALTDLAGRKTYGKVVVEVGHGSKSRL